MDLIKVTDRIFYYPFEDDRDRPALGYIQGDRFSVAVDAGHSRMHVEEFYEALKRSDLPLPELTIITHWHWDHSFGLAYIHGISLAHELTNVHLRKIAGKMPDYQKTMMEMDECIAKEYASGEVMRVKTADLEYQNRLSVNAGGVTLKVFHIESPHTDDSTLIYIPSEKTLFTGDVQSGEYPTWRVDQKKLMDLYHVISSLEIDHVITAHWEIKNKEELLDAMTVQD